MTQHGTVIQITLLLSCTCCSQPLNPAPITSLLPCSCYFAPSRPLHPAPGLGFVPYHRPGAPGAYPPVLLSSTRYALHHSAKISIDSTLSSTCPKCRSVFLFYASCFAQFCCSLLPFTRRDTTPPTCIAPRHPPERPLAFPVSPSAPSCYLAITREGHVLLSCPLKS